MLKFANEMEFSRQFTAPKKHDRYYQLALNILCVT